MSRSIVTDDPQQELSAILTLLDEGKADDAVNAYESFIFKWDDRIVDIGGTANLRFIPRSYRRRGKRR